MLLGHTLRDNNCQHLQPHHVAAASIELWGCELGADNYNDDDYDDYDYINLTTQLFQASKAAKNICLTCVY